MINQKIRKLQLRLLKEYSKTGKSSFALSGGTALELFYLKHRFSRDLDFFSPEYNINEIENIVSLFNRNLGLKIKLQDDFKTANHARVRFYSLNIKGSGSLKIDFVEDVLIKNPKVEIDSFFKIPVYNIHEIYFQKILAITGIKIDKDITGREQSLGRNEVRDVVDLYYLSQRIKPISQFVTAINHSYSRGLVHWCSTYDRMDFKIKFLELDIYDKKLDSKSVIAYLDEEILKKVK